MKKLIVVMLALAVTNIYARSLNVTCKHLAGTNLVNKLSLQYVTDDNDKWTQNVLISVESGEFEIEQGIYSGRLRSSAANRYTPDSIDIFFVPTVNADYDGADIKFFNDDVLGKLAVLEYVSDGPEFTQFLICE
jgi:hypothetical protein